MEKKILQFQGGGRVKAKKTEKSKEKMVAISRLRRRGGEVRVLEWPTCREDSASPGASTWTLRRRTRRGERRRRGGIARCLSTGETEGRRERWKMAVTRQVDLMNKWKAVDTADEGLLSVRAQYQEKMVEFAQRWSKVKHFLSLLKKNYLLQIIQYKIGTFQHDQH